MASQIPQITVEKRDRIGTRYARRLRESGRMPAVIYGHKQDPVHVTVDAEELTRLLHDNAHLLNVQLEGHAESCLIKDVQWNHLGSHVIHVDLARVDLSETVEVEVTIEFKGEAVGLKSEGAIVEHRVSELTIECRADSIPEVIVVDVSHLDVEDAITVADVKLPEGVTCTMDPETVVAQVSVVQEELEEAPTEAAAEPEIIGKKAEAEEEAGDEDK